MINTKVCWYVSDYGYGHAARSIAIIRKWLQSHPTIQIIVCASRNPLTFLQQSLASFSSSCVQFLEISTEMGYILDPVSLEPNLIQMRERYRQYLHSWRKRVQMEKQFLRQQRPLCVVSDISPIPFLAADELGIPSVGISNFTWFTAYEDILPAHQLDTLRTAYSCMDYFIALIGAEQEPRWGRMGHANSGFFSREVHPEEVHRIRQMVDPHRKKTIVFYGMGMSIDHEAVSAHPFWSNEECIFLVPSHMSNSRSNVMRIPASYPESQNYVAAADVVITKPGWSTVSEAYCNSKPMILLRRKGFREDRSTLDVLEREGRCKGLALSQLSDLRLNFDFVDRLTQEQIQQSSNSEAGNSLMTVIDHLQQIVTKEVHRV
ncbi:hypothetical protein [Paenibacillus koleovorans]|uniref:hypothetical protein n=1 Tax=Paenibacillus koleovorans TaxID=121608 RepID=UPI000FD9E7C7|nr:hypothetical protein [Paenibacillus koleovorans]